MSMGHVILKEYYIDKETPYFKEYAKEFLAEGQLFYYCKRNELTKFPYGYQTATEDNVYVLPKPDDEIEFGDYYTTDETK